MPRFSAVTEKSARAETLPAHFVGPARPAPRQRQTRLTGKVLLALIGGGLVIAGLVGIALGHRSTERVSRATRLAARGAALLAASVLVDSAMEHYRGSYRKRPMIAAPFTAATTLAAALATVRTGGQDSLTQAVFGAAVATGLFGTGFHFKNITDRTGGLTLNNLFYRAPFGAPGALLLAGAAGIGASAAERVARARQVDGGWSGGRGTVGRGLGVLTATSLFGLTAEVGLLHFRGAFHNRLMYLPVIGVPATGLLLLAALPGDTANTADTANAIGTAQTRRRAGRALTLTAVLGVLGSGLHAFGVSRNMGGFANWSQNLFAGPPIAAPPSLAGIALLGHAALELLSANASSSADVIDGSAHE